MKRKWELKAFKDWYLAITGECGQRLALELAQDRDFWKRRWFKYGWEKDSTPYERALRDIQTLKEQDLNFMRWFYEESGIFEPENFRASKVGSWCYWVSIKFLIIKTYETKTTAGTETEPAAGEANTGQVFKDRRGEPLEGEVQAP